MGEYRDDVGVHLEEEDGSPSFVVWKVKVPNGSLTDNDDGTGSLEFSQSAPPVTAKNTGGTLTVAELNQVITVNSASAQTITSPSVGSDENGFWIEICKLGAGKVTFQAADTDVIYDGTAGGTVYNEESGETYASIKLRYVHAATKWFMMGGLGTWVTT